MYFASLHPYTNLSHYLHIYLYKNPGFPRRKTKVWMLQFFLEKVTKYSQEEMWRQSVEQTEAKAIQRLSHLGIYPIYSHQTQILLWMPGRPC